MKLAKIAIVGELFVIWSLAVACSGSGDEAQVAGQTTETATVAQLPTETLNATSLPTAGPTAAQSTVDSYPTLSAPPPKPLTPLPPVEGYLTGGRWYTLPYWCATFYVPAGYAFGTDSALNDPGGYTTLALILVGVDGAETDEYVAFRTDDASEVGREARSDQINQAFDQIAETMERTC